MGFFKRRSQKYVELQDQRHLEVLIDQYDELMAAGWEDKNALGVVFGLAEDSYKVSDEVRVALCSYPPIAEAVEANREMMSVKMFLRDPDVPMLHFPG